jgi:hypothetical protein
VNARRLFFLLVLAIFGLIGLGGIYRLHYFLLTNKAIYLANRQEFHEAQALLEYVVNNHPQSVRARRALAQVELDLGNYANAEFLLIGLETSPDIKLEKAICYYESGREAEAVEELAAIPISGKSRCEPLLAAVVTNGLRVIQGNPPSSEFLSIKCDELARAQARFLLSLQSRGALMRGNLVRAREFAARAVALGDRNPIARRVAVISCAATLDFAKAKYFADISVRQQFDWNALLADIAKIETDLTSRTIAPEFTSLQEYRRLALAGAKAWALAEIGNSNDDTSAAAASVDLAKLIAESMPYEVRYRLLYADALAGAGRQADAYQLLRRWSEQHDSYVIDLRMAVLAGSAPDDVFQKYENAARVVARLSADDFLTTNVVRKKNVLAFYEAGKCGASFSVPAPGKYLLVLTARGDRAFGLSPLVAVRLNGKKAQDAYIAKEQWDVYTIAAELEAGHHSLELEYLNNSERLPSNEEDRNFYLHNVMITRFEDNESGTNSVEQ